METGLGRWPIRSPAFGKVWARDPATGALGRRIAAALAEERQRSGRLGAHALTLAYVVIAIWCALVHSWPEAVFYLGLVAAFVDAAAWATSVFTACLITGIHAAVVYHTQKLVTAQARVERARDNLARHVSANLVDELAELDEPFGPARIQNAAILFADVIGFTRLCEGRAPEAVMAMLRGFHERMAECVFEAGGTLDKFVGDSVMATFGTPKPGCRDAANALACARKMLACLYAWNIERRAHGEPVLRIGIGLHFGPVVLGTIGHERRLEYAVLGDTVNTASRLEALSRDLQTSLVSSHALIERIRAEVGESSLRGLHRHAPVTVRGRTQATDVWILAEHRRARSDPRFPGPVPRPQAASGTTESRPVQACPLTGRLLAPRSTELHTKQPAGPGR